jgi:hypothetical protein
LSLDCKLMSAGAGPTLRRVEGSGAVRSGKSHPGC